MEAKLGEFAWNLGMAFQLVDDILDFTSREKTLGKPVGSDLREGKVTLPLVYALETRDARRAADGRDRDRRRATTSTFRSCASCRFWSGTARSSARMSARTRSPKNRAR